jgi:hypothetical protein
MNRIDPRPAKNRNRGLAATAARPEARVVVLEKFPIARMNDIEAAFGGRVI